MSSLGSISPVSLPLYDRYAESASAWSAVHGGYSELAPDASFVADEGDWSGEHASYTDEYVPSGEVDEPSPDWQAMWAMAHGIRGSQVAEGADGSLSLQALQGAVVQRNETCLEDAVDCTPSVSGGSVNIIVQRGGAANDVPAATTSLHVTVLGTDVEASLSFPRSAPSMDVPLSGVPSGYQIVKVEALSPSGVLTTMQVMVYVPESPGSSTDTTREMPTAVPHETGDRSADGVRPREIRPEDTRAGNPHHVQAVHERPVPQSSWPTDDERRAVGRAAPCATETNLALPASVDLPRADIPDTLSEIRAGEVMASAAAVSDLGPVVEHRVRTSGEWALPAAFLMKVRESLGSAMDGRADRRRPPEEDRRSSEDHRRLPDVAVGVEPDQGPQGDVLVDLEARTGFRQESGSDSLEILHGALDLRAGFEARDDRSVWQECVKSTAVGLILGGNAAVSPLMIGLGMLLHPRAAARFR